MSTVSSLSLVSLVFPMSTVSPLSLVSLVSLVSSFPFNKHEIFGGVALFFIWCKNLDGFHCFHMTCGLFLACIGGQRM